MTKLVPDKIQQKNSSIGVPRKSWSEKILQIYRRAPMQKCDFNKNTLRHRCSHVNLVHIFRTPSAKLPLEVYLFFKKISS